MLKIVGLDEEVKTLLGGQVNSLCNVLTLGLDVYQHFGMFDIWLEEVSGQVRFTLYPVFSSPMILTSNPTRKIHMKW